MIAASKEGTNVQPQSRRRYSTSMEPAATLGTMLHGEARLKAQFRPPHTSLRVRWRCQSPRQEDSRRKHARREVGPKVTPSRPGLRRFARQLEDEGSSPRRVHPLLRSALAAEDARPRPAPYKKTWLIKGERDISARRDEWVESRTHRRLAGRARDTGGRAVYVRTMSKFPKVIRELCGTH